MIACARTESACPSLQPTAHATAAHSAASVLAVTSAPTAGSIQTCRSACARWGPLVLATYAAGARSFRFGLAQAPHGTALPPCARASHYAQMCLTTGCCGAVESPRRTAGPTISRVTRGPHRCACVSHPPHTHLAARMAHAQGLSCGQCVLCCAAGCMTRRGVRRQTANGCAGSALLCSRPRSARMARRSAFPRPQDGLVCRKAFRPCAVGVQRRSTCRGTAAAHLWPDAHACSHALVCPPKHPNSQPSHWAPSISYHASCQYQAVSTYCLSSHGAAAPASF